MRERLVGVGHLMGVFTLLDRVAAAVEGIEQLGGELLGHAVARTIARGLDDPANGESLAALRADFDGHLVGGAADAARADFDGRLHVLQRLVEGGDRILLELAFDLVEGAVDDTLGNRLLATLHERVHELRDDEVVELGVRKDFTFFSSATARHVGSSALLRTLRAVLRTALTAVLDTLRIESAANDVVADARKVLHAT